MKNMAWVAAWAVLLVAPAVFAQQTLAHASSTAPPPGSALPPPGIDDPGAVPLPSTGIPPSVAPAARQHQGSGDSTNVSTSTDANGDTIEQYSRGGHVYMVTVKPKHGVTQTYRVNSPNGSLVHDPRTGAVAPVYYDVYKWGKPAKPASASSSGG